MIVLCALFLLAPSEMRLPSDAACPDAVISGDRLQVVYGQNQNGWYLAPGIPVRINSSGGSVQAAGERGPKIAIAGKTICVAWQGDYRLGPVASFSRSLDGGHTFEKQRNLIDGKTPGLDHVEIAASGDLVAVFWLDGRGGPDPDAPVTSEIWYSLSRDGGATFGSNQPVFAFPKIRACACCSFSLSLDPAGMATIAYRSGVKNVRDIYLATGNIATNQWSTTRISNSNWTIASCPMDGPRRIPGATAYSIKDKAYYKADASSEPVELGTGRFADIAQTSNGPVVSWQDGSSISWRAMNTGESGRFAAGTSRAALVTASDGRPLIIH